MDFKSVILEQREELEDIERRERIIGREGMERAAAALVHPNILAVLGVRRCGKSIFSYLLARTHNIGYVNFDDERLIGVKAGELNQILQAFYELYGEVEYIVLDEIQNVAGWELFANRLRRTKRVILTGSNSKLLAGELASHLTGRYLDFKLFPFSFREFLEFKGVETAGAYTTRQKALLLRLLREYLEVGGFPEAHKFGRAMISRIYEDIVTKDLLLRHKIKKIEEFRMLARYLVTNASSEYSYSRLGRMLGIKHVSTVSNWIAYLEGAFLIFKLERFDFKLKKQFIAPKKAYCVDTGMLNAIGFKLSENIGKAMENAVAMELMRLKSGDGELELYYWKDHLQKEVDFVVKKGRKIKELIQVSYIGSREEINQREISSLVTASRELKCKELLLITWDFEGEETMRGRKIRLIPLWKWLTGGALGKLKRFSLKDFREERGRIA